MMNVAAAVMILTVLVSVAFLAMLGYVAYVLAGGRTSSTKRVTNSSPTLTEDDWQAPGDSEKGGGSDVADLGDASRIGEFDGGD